MQYKFTAIPDDETQYIPFWLITMVTEFKLESMPDGNTRFILLSETMPDVKLWKKHGWIIQGEVEEIISEQ